MWLKMSFGEKVILKIQFQTRDSYLSMLSGEAFVKKWLESSNADRRLQIDIPILHNLALPV